MVQLVLQLQELIREDIQGYNATGSTSEVVREQRPFFDLLRTELSSYSHGDEQLTGLTQIIVEDVSAIRARKYLLTWHLIGQSYLT